MFCPECQAEYLSGYTHCPDCDADLVDALPEEEELDDDEIEYDPDITFVEILRTSSLTDVAFIKSVLDGEEIPYYINGELGMTMRHAGPMVLMVAEEDAEKAAKLLENII